MERTKILTENWYRVLKILVANNGSHTRNQIMELYKNTYNKNLSKQTLCNILKQTDLFTASINDKRQIVYTISPKGHLYYRIYFQIYF